MYRAVEGSTTVQDVLYADDLALVEQREEDVNNSRHGVEKSKVPAVVGGEVTALICLNGQTLEVDSFAYLGSSIDKSGKASAEVDIRIEKGGTAY